MQLLEKDVLRFIRVALGRVKLLTTFFRMNGAMWTTVFLASDNKALLGVVCDVGSEKWVSLADVTICTRNLNPILSSIYKWVEKSAQALVKKVMALRGSPFVCKAFEFAYRDIPQKDHGTGARLSAN